MTVRVSPRARLDLFEIWDYIATDSVVQADKMSDALDGLLSLLAENPEMGRDRSELEPGLRSFPTGHYVIFYNAVQGGIEVLRVLHGARDIPDILEK
ncbi:MAG: toxin ParE1/3/4 [Rhodothermales bacterium]|jgi:toxin ParE1/3/4